MNQNKYDEELIVYLFNRWLRIGVGAMFIGVGLYEGSYVPALFGIPFVIAGIRNRGCHGECYFPPPKKVRK